MAVTLKCPDCGHTVQTADDTPQTCPNCEGTMKKPAYKAKSGPTSSDREKPKSKTKSKRDDDDDEDEPKPKKKSAARSDDDDGDDLRSKKKSAKRQSLSLDDDDEKGAGSTRNGKAADSLGLNPGFTHRALMKQVEDELSRGEVLHWAARPSREIAQKSANNIALVGFLFAGLGGLISLGLFLAPVPWYVGLFPLLFVAIGILLAVIGPKMTMKQAERGWYAVTDRRAIVFQVSLFGSGGQATSYEPSELRRMRVQKSSVVEGGGDLIFKTEVSHHTHTQRDARGRTRTSTSTSTHHFGFMGIEQVREVETLIHNILLGGSLDRDDDDDDDE